MNTNYIKSFAQEARILLREGIKARLIYWGFEENGNNPLNLEETTGGYTFRQSVFTDTAVPAKWKKLKARLTNKQAVEDVIEEAAYTWFNRLMAIKILEKNGYIEKHLEYDEGVKVPLMVQNAKRGNNELKEDLYKNLLKEYLREDKDEEAFGLLLTRFCSNNTLLKEVFGRIDDYTEILLPLNLLQNNGFLDLLNSDLIRDEEYQEVELIGWLYQFYISDKKDEVFKGFKNNKKARAEDIPAATQIFTPKWIVKYMVENTVGKTYLDLEPESPLKQEMKYLVVNETESTVAPIISDIPDLTLLDPACGSGHILVTGFELLFKIYREAGHNAKQATLSILEHNLYGLDIDDRAMQLARFAVLLKAAKEYPEILQPIGRQQKIQLPHIYAFPEAANFTNEELQTFLGNDREHLADLKEALQLLNQGKNIGSALIFDLTPEARKTIANCYQNWKTREHNLDFNEQLIWNTLKAFVEVLLVITHQYTAVVANPPYMGQKSMNADLKNYVNKNYPKSKSDLFAVFMEVCLNLTSTKAYMGMINQHSWMFLSSYEKLRNQIIDNFSIKNMLHLGPRTFEELSGEVVQSTAFVLQNINPNELHKGDYFRLVDFRNNDAKEANFLKASSKFSNIPQTNFEKIPGNPISYWVSEKEFSIIDNNVSLGEISEPRAGLQTSDNKRFLRYWSEVAIYKIGFYLERDKALNSNFKWFPHNKGGGKLKWYGNNNIILNFENDGKELKYWLENNPSDPTTKHWSRNLRNYKFYFQEGITWNAVSSSGTSVRYTPKGFLFDTSGPMLFAEENLNYILAFLNSCVFSKFIDIFSQTLSTGSGDFSKVPFLLNKNNKIEHLVEKNILISKKNWDSRETSWDFEQSSLVETEASSLKEAFIQWLNEAKEDFFQLHQNEEDLNRIFIDIYGLQEELTAEVPLKDITILQEELNRKSLEKLEPKFRKNGKDTIKLPIQEDEVMAQFISYLIGVMMGRYRLDKPGLNIAHPNPSEEETATYTYNGHKIDIDKDAILPLMGEDCAFPDDVLAQAKKLLHAIWGEDSLTDNLNFLQQSLGSNLHNWLTIKFWKYHTGMYKKKPIYWLFASNPKKPEKSAFRVLVYMHRMDKFTVQQIQRNYLYPHQDYVKSKLLSLKENEANLSREEQKELEKLQSWELELRDYNEVLKDLANQQIEFDLDDGVSVNYEKFEGAVAVI
jgi:hypothetical protein